MDHTIAIGQIRHWEKRLDDKMMVLRCIHLLAFVSTTQAFVSLDKYNARTKNNLQFPTSLSAPTSTVSTPSRRPRLPLFADSNKGINGSNKMDDDGFASPLDRPLLAVVDAASLVGFAAVGKASHSGPNGSLDMAAVLQTALPFLAAWFVTSPLTGVYKETDDKNKNLALSTAQQVLVGWAVAIPLGCALRGVIKGYVPPTSFVIVTLIATLIILSVSRIVFALLEDFFVELVN